MKPVCDTQDYCPLWRKPCKKVCHTCHWYTQIRGSHPQTGVEMDEWKCAIALMPILTIETSRVVNQTNATMDNLRNEMHQDNRNALLASVMNTKALLGKPQ
jgi:hypothetical protein